MSGAESISEPGSGPALSTPALSTPALIVDLDVFAHNVSEMAALLRGTGKTVRPHVKTHRTPELARRQLGEGVVGVTCATIGEAEAMVAAGIDDVFVANEIVSPAKLDRTVALARAARVTVAADDAEPVIALSERAARAGVTVGVLVDVDIMLHRCGVASSADALELARVVERSPGLHLTGLMGYEGRVRSSVENRGAKIASAYAVLAEVRESLLRAGLPVECVSAAGTSTLKEALVDPTITEIQAGVYALMEPELLDMGLPFRCAAVVRGTVISRHPDRFVVDIGRRAVGVEYGPPVICAVEATSIRVGDEHTIVALDGPAPPLGAHVDFIPGQIRTTFNLHGYVWVSRGGQIVDRWPVSARGGSQ
jgi:D-serine deaminase-like pyridoxal phosphate-dependent protein